MKGSKAAARLKRRQESFEKTVAKLKNPSGYHKPGSSKKSFPKGNR